jgi:hypothetical protein
VRTALYVIGFASIFWLVATFLAGASVFLVGWPQSDEPASDAWGLLFLIPLAAGGIYGWFRSKRQTQT